MRRVTMVVAVCLCAVAGCRGGAAQEPYNGVGAANRGPSSVVPIPVVPATAPEPMASEVDLPWTIALLSDAEGRPVEAPVHVVEAEAVTAADEASPEEESSDLEVAVDEDTPDEKHQPPGKSCPGVVKGRS